MPLGAGARLGPYEIVGALGAGGTILYVPTGNSGAFITTSTGGEPSRVNLREPGADAVPSGADTGGTYAGLSTARWPAFLPDGEHFLFQIRDPSPERKGVYVGSLGDSSMRQVVSTDWGAQYADGHLLLLNGSTLMAQSFDPNTGSVTGSPAAIVQPVAGASTGYGSFSVSATGVLAYSTGFLAPSELRWIDRTGRLMASVAPADDYVDLRLSPDDSRLAFSRTDQRSQAPDVWVRDLARGTESRLTSQPLTDAAPVWSPAGEQIIFRSNRVSANLELFRTRPTAGAEAEIIYSGQQQRSAHGMNPSNVLSTDWSPDGRFMIYHVTTGSTGYDLWALPLAGEPKPVLLAGTQYNEVQGYVSPDGRWIAYASDESGKYEIYVQSFPDASTAQKTTVSTGGGLQPRWSRDGRELFYLRADGTLMAVAVRTRPTFEPGNVTPLFKTPLPTNMNAYRMDYDAARDGQRFLMKIPVEGSTPPSITVVLNWTALLKK